MTLESKYLIDIEQAMKNLEKVDNTIGDVEDVINRTGKNQSFDVLSKNVQNFNRVLADGQTIYRKIEVGAKSYREEVIRLEKAERELIKSQANFKNSFSYDEAEKSLQTVRKRIAELNAELNQTEKSGKKSEGIFSSLGGVAKTAGVAIAGFFALSQLTDFEGQIIEQTKNYEKYFAVLKNGFGDENKATEGLQMIYDFASATPFSVNEITESFIKLNNRGITPTQAELTKLGDLASSQGKGIDQVTEALLDATTGEFERLKEVGIRAKTVGDNVTLTFKGVSVTVNKFNEGALKDAVLGFGALKGVAGSMATVSETLEGKISNLGDSYDQLLVSLGKSQGFLSTVIGLFKSLLDGIKSFVDVPLEKKLQQENAELNVLANSLILASDNQAVRNRLLTELSQKYPSFLALLGKETDNNYAIANALSLVNEQYRIKIRLAGQDVLAKRNAEGLANSLEDEAKALDKVQKVLAKANISTTKFASLSKDEQQKLINDLGKQAFTEASKRQTFDLSKEFGNTRGRAAETEVKRGFEAYYKAKEQQNQLESKGVQIETTKLDLTNAQVVARNSAISRMKEENKLLEKSLISQAEFNKISAFDYKNPAEQKALDNFTKFKANSEQIVTFGKQGEEPAKPATKTSTGGAGTGTKPSVKDVREEIEKLSKEEEKYRETIYKMELEAGNVRLSLLDKNSKVYLERKRAYDLEVLEQEKKGFLDLYTIQLSNQLLEEELSKKGKKITEEELNNLRESTRAKAETIAKGTGANGFDNSESTQSQRELILAKRNLIEFNYSNELRTIEEKANKEQLERLDAQNNLLGEGLEKQIITIQNKYSKLIETYEKDLALVTKLEIKRAEEIAKARLTAGEKSAEDGTAISKATINSRTLPKGANEADFERANKRDLIELDIDFYNEKYRLLKEYLTSAGFLQAEQNGLISKEEKENYKQRLETYRKGVQDSNDSLDKFLVKSTSTGKVYKENWEVISDVFELVTGKALKFADNPEIDEKIKQALSNSVSAVRDAYSNILQAQLESANERISALDTEISERQGRVNQEFENYKNGYANNYIEEKKNLDLKKKEREEELANKKKIQKEQAVLDSTTIASTNAVTIATMISNAAAAFKTYIGFPFVGIALAIGAIATIVSTVSGISAKVKQATKLRYGGEIFGNLHQAGGVRMEDSGIEFEGGEFVTRREQYKKKPDLFEALNNDTFSTFDERKQRELLKPFGMKLSNARQEELRLDLRNKDLRDRGYLEKTSNDRYYEMVKNGLEKVADNTANISEFDYVQSGTDVLKFNKKGKLIEVIKKGNE